MPAEPEPEPRAEGATAAKRGAVDPRLLRYAASTRPFLIALTVLGVVTGALIIAQALLLAHLISSAFQEGRSLAALRAPLEALLLVVVARGAIAWGRELLAARSSARAKSQLRRAVLEHAAALGPRAGSERRTAELAVLATRGIDALDAYFSLYLPQLVLAMIVPLAVVVVVATQDWIPALIIAGTLPLIPLFMALVGAATRDRMELQLRTLQQLAGHFMDVVAGLPTLKVFGRAKAQIRSIGEITDRYRQAAMSTLRVTFLSSLILELVSTISVALVAVTVGLQLLGGNVGLRSALVILILAPEAYLPLRLLELPVREHETRSGPSVSVPDLSASAIVVQDLKVVYEGRDRPALEGLSLTVEPGEVVALTGPSGCGKSTLLAVLLGFVTPDRGSVTVGGIELAALDPEAWRSSLAWMPQRPHLFSASIADNIRLGRRDAGPEQVSAAVAAAGLAEVVRARPEGLDTRLGDRGVGLSVGERQRVALARAFLRQAPLLLLDEPTANLDGATEDEVLADLRRVLRGRTALLVAHRPALVALADRVVELGELAVAV
jgi:ABC-type transport system involved in cytochrome bd biosynthesis fused ATPase/permease subunit